MSQYKNLRRFIYMNVKAEYRGEGYRLVRKTIAEERERCAKIAGRFIGDIGDQIRHEILGVLDGDVHL